MTDNIELTLKNVKICADFRAKYLDAPGFLNTHNCTLGVEKPDCALAGKIFGKSGWTRKTSWGNTFNWHRTIDDVAVTINDAEDNEINGSPVAPTQFPLQLADI